MKTELLVTGDEILKGDITDTNSKYISAQLLEKGIKTSRISIAGDDESAISAILEEISSRADIAIVTGGLGPTSDDVTALSASMASGSDLEEKPEAVDMIVSSLKKIGAIINPSNLKQALLPAASECIQNTAGIAPGFRMQINQCTFFFLPGVPDEMKKMLDTEVIPAVCELKGVNGKFLEHRITLHGIAEASANEILSDFRDIFPSVTLGFRAISPGVIIKISIEEKNINDEAVINSALLWITEKFGSRVVSTSGKSLEETVGNLLASKKMTVSVAESCTGGLIGHLLTSVSGSSDYFLLSAVTYANSAKISVLGVSPETLEKYGAVHEYTALEMAEGVRRISGSDLGLSVTGIAGPSGGTADKPVGTVCIGISGASGTMADTFFIPGFDRAVTKRRFAFQALDILRKGIIGNL